MATRAPSWKQRGMKQVTDTGAIEKVVDEIIAKNPDKVARCEDQSESNRLVRRPGDEVIRRQGKPACGQRYPQTQTWILTRATSLAAHKLFPNWFLENARAQNFRHAGDVMVRERRRVGRLTERIAESLHPDLSVFDRFRLSERLARRYLCKIFSARRCTIVNTVNLNCRAQCARKLSPKTR